MNYYYKHSHFEKKNYNLLYKNVVFSSLLFCFLFFLHFIIIKYGEICLRIATEKKNIKVENESAVAI